MNSTTKVSWTEDSEKNKVVQEDLKKDDDIKWEEDGTEMHRRKKESSISKSGPKTTEKIDK